MRAERTAAARVGVPTLRRVGVAEVAAGAGDTGTFDVASSDPSVDQQITVGDATVVGVERADQAVVRCR